MEPQPADEAIITLLRSMNKGQYLLLCEAIRQLGGELRLDLDDFAMSAQVPAPHVEVAVEERLAVVKLR